MAGVLDVAKRLNKSWKDETLALEASILPHYKRLKCRDLGFTYPLWGGLPLGRISVFAGKEHSGKSTAACLQIAEYQKQFPDKVCVYVDVEHSLDLEFQETMTGMDLSKLVYVSPSSLSGEQILDMIIQFQEEAEDIGLIVLDSIPALVSGKEFENDIEKDLGRAGGMARPLHRFTKIMADLVNKKDNMLIFINQVRVKGTTFTGAAIYDEPGGSAPKFYASVKVRFGTRTFTKGDKTDVRESDSEGSDGFRLSFVITKNKTGNLTRGNGGFLTFRYATGLDYMFDNIEICIKSGLIERPTNMTYIPVNLITGEVYKDAEGNDLKFVGKQKLIDYFDENIEFKEEYLNMISEYISDSANNISGNLLDIEIAKSIQEEEEAVK